MLSELAIKCSHLPQWIETSYMHTLWPTTLLRSPVALIGPTFVSSLVASLLE